MTEAADVERVVRGGGTVKEQAKKVYVYRDAPPGYGPRVFVLYADVATLDAVLKRLSTWGGHDKDTGKAKGYEFPSSEPWRFADACAYAASRGFQVVDAAPENGAEFWE